MKESNSFNNLQQNGLAKESKFTCHCKKGDKLVHLAIVRNVGSTRYVGVDCLKFTTAVIFEDTKRNFSFIKLLIYREFTLKFFFSVCTLCTPIREHPTVRFFWRNVTFTNFRITK